VLASQRLLLSRRTSPDDQGNVADREELPPRNEKVFGLRRTIILTRCAEYASLGRRRHRFISPSADNKQWWQTRYSLHLSYHEKEISKVVKFWKADRAVSRVVDGSLGRTEGNMKQRVKENE